MIDFAGKFVIYLFIDGLYQLLLASAVAVTILPLASWIGRWNYCLLLGRFALFNVFLLGWGSLGNAVWLFVTADRLWVLDDAPVWAPYLPPLPCVFDYAGGGRDAWGLLGHTTFPQLYPLWLATSAPVWILAALSLAIRVRFSFSTRRQHGCDAA